jgi:hypothetical protein
MGRFSRFHIVVFAVAGVVASTGSAHATCAIPNAGYQGGAYGAYAVTTGGCFSDDLDANGGAESTNASASSSIMGSGGPFSLSSTADLTTGVLTADSQSGFASASIWDSFTYTGLPAAGATITATLSLPGTLTGSSDGFAWLEEGSQTDFNNGTELFGTDDPVFFNAASKPSSMSQSFNVTNGETVIVFAEIQAIGEGSDNVADLGDPPMLSLTLPEGATVATAADFHNFTSAVPEPSTWAMVLISFAGLGFLGCRRRTPLA